MNDVSLGDYLKVTRLDGDYIEYGLIVKVIGKEEVLLEYGERETYLNTIRLDSSQIKVSEDDDFKVIDVYVISSLFMEG
ncbi:hypothetical protein ACWEXK_12390 [Staphylococcus xylosus]|uniref:hypothetical protein n=1 Tax=Staphylococcus xylosus TaxID=1288 RepID=UPI000D1ED70D|nr:hypothetical protein [Staphylococcus xylosus]PTI27792.1 hypothetical protein BU115_03340 [Staphylococcus xylosus]